jgi:hypothetical protein
MYHEKKQTKAWVQQKKSGVPLAQIDEWWEILKHAPELRATPSLNLKKAWRFLCR